jgi:dihydroxy-acid dehydratase
MEAEESAAWKPIARDRKVSKALEAYAALATSASRGAVRDVTQIQRQNPHSVGEILSRA